MYFFFVLLLWTDHVSSSHFNGGTITWQPLNSSDTTSPIAIAITQTYSWVYSVVPCTQAEITAQSPINTVYNDNDNVRCITSCSSGYGYTPVPIARYCTSFSPALGITNTQRTDIVQLSANASFSIAFTPASAAYWRPLKAVSTATSTTATWSITSSINLNRRADTGTINTAPIANVISPVEIPLNTPHQITIPVIDANNDIVRCRWAKKTPIDECMDVCPPNSLPAGASLSTNCTLYVTGTFNESWYVAANMVEDFPDTSSTTPLSSVPVQFLIHVVQPASCSILPRVSSLNITNMACVGVQTTIQYTSKLYINNYCGSSVSIVAVSVQSFPGMVTGPLTTINSSLYSMSLTWTPTSLQIGLQMLCAIAQDSQSQQSLQFCLVFSVAVGGTGTCPGVSSVTTTTTTTSSVTTATVSVITASTSVTTQQPITTETMITTMEMSTMSKITTNTATETTERIIFISSTTSALQSTLTTTNTEVLGSPINLPLIIGLSLLALLLALLCCCLYLYCLFLGSRNRRRQQKRRRDRMDPLQNENNLLGDAESRTPSVIKQLTTTKLSAAQSSKSSAVDRVFEKKSDPPRSVEQRISTVDAAPKIRRRRSSVNVVRVGRSLTAGTNNKPIQPISAALIQPEPDAFYPQVTRVNVAKKPKVKSSASPTVRVVKVAMKSNKVNSLSTVSKADGNNQGSNECERSFSALKRIKTRLRNSLSETPLETAVKFTILKPNVTDNDLDMIVKNFYLHPGPVKAGNIRIYLHEKEDSSDDEVG